MLEIIDKEGIKKRVTVWFSPEDYTTKEKCDVCCYVGVSRLHNARNRYVKFSSLITDLTLDIETIRDSFSKVNKYDIRRSDRDDIEVLQITSQELCQNDIWYRKYQTVYEGMYEKKGRAVKAPIDSMKLYARDHALLMTAALLEAEPVVFHVYIVDGENAKLNMSCSVFRDNEDKQFRALIGRANKRLHFYDIKYFKDNGYKTYDWGGISSFEAPNGIDQFKMSFGGGKIEYYDETILCSFKYKLFYGVKNLLIRYLHKQK